MYAEYVGLTAEALELIERFRTSPSESRSEIICRILSPLLEPKGASEEIGLDLGQGVQLQVGERPLLFLSKKAKQANKPDAVAEVRADGFYLAGQRVPNSRKGNPLDPAMKQVQEQKNDRNEKGEIKSLSSWRQWHVERDGRLVALDKLKDPKLAHGRGRPDPAVVASILEELGLDPHDIPQN